MASPVGHALAGYAIGRIGEPPRAAIPLRWAACTALAMAPDLDFVPGILAEKPALYHQGVSHSLVAALGVSLVAALALARGRALPRVWLVCFAAYASHCLLDLLGSDARAPIGMPLLWPFDDTSYLSPWTLLPGIQHAEEASTATREWLSSIASWYNVKAIMIEVAVVAPLVAIAELRRRRAGHRREAGVS